MTKIVDSEVHEGANFLNIDLIVEKSSVPVRSDFNDLYLPGGFIFSHLERKGWIDPTGTVILHFEATDPIAGVKELSAGKWQVVFHWGLKE